MSSQPVEFINRADRFDPSVLVERPIVGQYCAQVGLYFSNVLVDKLNPTDQTSVRLHANSLLCWFGNKLCQQQQRRRRRRHNKTVVVVVVVVGATMLLPPFLSLGSPLARATGTGSGRHLCMQVAPGECVFTLAYSLAWDVRVRLEYRVLVGA